MFTWYIESSVGLIMTSFLGLLRVLVLVTMWGLMGIEIEVSRIILDTFLVLVESATTGVCPLMGEVALCVRLLSLVSS